jgi:hypothetical protein
MDGYEYERKVLWPMWNKQFTGQNASSNKNTKDRLKDELGIQIKKDPLEVEKNIRKTIVGNPDNFYPELSPDYELFKSTKRSKWV